MNDDRRPDLLMGEHRGALRLSIWRNLGGFENHLGARAVDLDGDRDIVSIGWDAAETIHVWRNDAAAPSR